MKIFRLNKIKKFRRASFEDVVFRNLVRTNYLSLNLDKYGKKVKTPFMYKNRPHNGKEILVLLQGKIRFRTKNKTEVVDADKEGPAVVVVNAKEYRQYENIGNNDAKFVAIFAPPFSIKEVSHMVKK